MVIATQNPVDQEGTYRLPESQLDRFLLRITLGYPGRAAELAILDGRGAADWLPKLSPVVSADEVMAMIDAVRAVFLADALKAYMVDIAETSRRHPAIELGLSPRATLQLAAAARSHAAARGRRYATPDDVKAMAGAGAQPSAAAAHGPGCPARSRATRSPRSSPTCPCRSPAEGQTMRARPSRQGVMVMVSGVGAIVVGRMFAVLELYVIGAAMLIAPLLGLAVVAWRRPRVEVERWIRPSVLTAGDTGRVEVLVEAVGRSHSPAFELVEPVGPEPDGAHGRRAAGAEHRRQRRLPGSHRAPRRADDRASGRGPPRHPRHGPVEHRGGGHGRGPRVAASPLAGDAAARAGRARPPPAGLAQRLGPGDFHSLRDYVEGDEPRTIHWRASARSEELKVRQHSVEGLQRCIVLLDQHVPPGPAEEDAFERAVTAAASVVHSADRAGLTTRFVTTEGADVSGPDVAAQTLHLLARIGISTDPTIPVERDPSEGLGLVVSIGIDPWTTSWAALDRIVDPALTALGVYTMDVRHRVPLLAVDARSEEAFLRTWTALAGRRAPPTSDATRGPRTRSCPRSPDDGHRHPASRRPYPPE